MRTVPEPLKGFVELVYDVNNHPAIRFLEPLLYRSPSYDEAAQSLHFSVVDEDDRPFVFSTPRLEERRSSPRCRCHFAPKASTGSSACESHRSLSALRRRRSRSRGRWINGSRGLFTEPAARGLRSALDGAGRSCPLLRARLRA